MKITGKHPKTLNDPILKHPAMKKRRWQIDPAAEPHTSFKKLNKPQVDEFSVNNMDTWTDTKHNDVDIGYNEFYEDLKPIAELKGGVGDATAQHDVDPIELSLGQTIEMEHTNDPNIATEIALDHLSEDPQYYTKLRKAGLARELDQIGSSTGFGDPDHPINNKKRTGTDITSTAGNNIIGKIGNTPDGHVEKFGDETSIISKNGNIDDYTVDVDIQEPSLDEDRCTDIAKRKYKKWPSAYASGAVVRCRKGKIWKKTNEELDINEKFDKEKKQGLHGWFARKGGKGGKGWVDCNTCRKNPKTGQKTCKSCGRQAGEKRDKYPACRPTPSQCTKTGVKNKKGPSTASWKKKNESIEYKHFFENAEMAQSDLTKIIDYSEKLQSMFNVNDNLEDWVKAKLNHACDYVATVRDYIKFYQDEKNINTEDVCINEKWSQKYKNSINCSNPKGFSQKAHCRAKKLRQSEAKSLKQCYKEAVLQLVREQNSSMAMGALKQLNNDAKELASMLTPEMSLEDWVKSKLNLAGEYLDDVYHHLDHFGPGGRKYDNDIKEASDNFFLSKLSKSILNEDTFGAPIIPTLPNKIKSFGTEWELGSNKVVGNYVYYGFDASYADKIHKLCVHYIYNQNPQFKELISDIYFYLIGRNPILNNIKIDIADYNHKKTPELDIIHGVVSGIPPQDIEHFVVDTKGFGGSKNKDKVGYIPKPSDL
jgi:hypothetical protein